MENEIQLLSDGDGLAVFGESTAVELFLKTRGFGPSIELGARRLSPLLSGGAIALDLASDIALGSGRWVQLTQESAAAAKNIGLMTNSTSGLSMGVVQGSGGTIHSIVQFASGPGAILANPAILAGAAGIMAQLALQQAMREITSYLKKIDAKVDDILQAQKDAAIAPLVGADMMIKEALTIRDEVGHVSGTTWSKVQGLGQVVATAQGYALRQLDGIATKLDREKDVKKAASLAKVAESSVREWLAVLAFCFQLQDALAVIELDHVLTSSPSDLDEHRIALRSARHKRLELIADGTANLMSRMDVAAGVADDKLLFHPIAPRGVVRSANTIGADVVEFNDHIGIERERELVESSRWVDAAADARDKAVETGADGVQAAKRIGSWVAGRAKTATNAVASEIAARTSAKPDDAKPDAATPAEAD